MKQMIDSNKFGNILWARGRYGKSVSKDFMKTGDRILLILWRNTNRSRHTYA